MKFEKIEPGMVLFDAHKMKAGNTTLSTMGVWRVRIVSVNKERRSAVVCWNGNPEQTWYERQLVKLRVVEPVLVKTGWTSRLQTKAEKSAARALPQGAL